MSRVSLAIAMRAIRRNGIVAMHLPNRVTRSDPRQWPELAIARLNGAMAKN